jgi:hypothetical protein
MHNELYSNHHHQELCPSWFYHLDFYIHYQRLLRGRPGSVPETPPVKSAGSVPSAPVAKGALLASHNTANVVASLVAAISPIATPPM